MLAAQQHALLLSSLYLIFMQMMTARHYLYDYAQHLRMQMAKIHLLLSLQVFVIRFNTFLQSEYTLMLILYAQMDSFLTKLADNVCLQKLVEERDICSTKMSKIYKSILAFYMRPMEYALANLLLKDDFLKNAQFVTLISRNIASYSQVEYFVERSVPLFSLLLLLLFTHCCLLGHYKSRSWYGRISSLPAIGALLTKTYLNMSGRKLLDEQEYHRLDILWHDLSIMHGPDNALHFPCLSKISRLVLTVTHSTADGGCIFPW